MYKVAIFLSNILTHLKTSEEDTFLNEEIIGPVESSSR